MTLSWNFKATKTSKILKLAAAGTVVVLMQSACTHTLHIPTVTYHSLRTERNLNPDTIPENAKILVQYNVNNDQELEVYVKNLTDEIMHIDQTTSFYVNPQGNSTSYYDPTVRTTSSTDISSSTSGASINLGAIGGFFGIGGALGGLLGGINVGGSHTNGVAQTISIAKVDLPVVSLAPKSMIKMSKNFKVDNLFSDFVESNYTYTNNPLKFSVCVSYSIGDINVNEKEKLVSDIYLSAYVSNHVQREGQLNDALREIFKTKRNCINEPWYRIHFVNNFKFADGHPGKKYDSYISGKGLVDYK